MGNICSDNCLKDVFNMYNGFERIQAPAALTQKSKQSSKPKPEKFQVMDSSDSFDDEMIQNAKYMP